ncbi:MAG: hypothetical protein IJ371_00930 [Clostridia bacterium]|nr:hypothetical protein [Clostridia bacterium]
MIKIKVQLLGGRGVGSGMYTKYSYKSLPKDPDDLTRNGWKETTDQRMPPHIRKFKNPKTGDDLEYHKGLPGEHGYRGKDHYHWKNPHSKNNKDFYLDKNGNPVPKNHKDSHLLP